MSVTIDNHQNFSTKSLTHCPLEMLKICYFSSMVRNEQNSIIHDISITTAIILSIKKHIVVFLARSKRFQYLKKTKLQKIILGWKQR